MTVQSVRAQLADGLGTVGCGSDLERLWALECARDDERGSVRHQSLELLRESD